MKTTTPIALALLLMTLAACSSSYQPAPVSKERASGGIPPLTGTLPNGVIGDSATK